MATAAPKPTVAPASCGDCRFAAVQVFGGDILICRRFPPGYGSSAAYPQPQVASTDWCGYYEAGTPFVPAPPLPACRIVPTMRQDNLTLVATPGEWTGAPDSYKYAWFVGGVEDTAQTGEVYTLPPEGPGEAFGKDAYCVVSATNVTGTTAAPPSDHILIVKPFVEVLPPVNVDVPMLIQQGAPDAAQAMLECTMGNWNNVPTAYVYHWTINDMPQGQTVENTFALTLPDQVGQVATCIVTASNSAGTVDAPVSNAVTIVGLPVAATATKDKGKDEKPGNDKHKDDAKPGGPDIHPRPDPRPAAPTAPAKPPASPGGRR